MIKLLFAAVIVLGVILLDPSRLIPQLAPVVQPVREPIIAGIVAAGTFVIPPNSKWSVRR